MTKKTDPTKTLTDLLGRFDVAMLVTRTAEGELRARPMATAAVKDPGDVSFVTSLDSPKIDEIELERQVCATFSRTGAFASLSGVATIHRDPARARKLWQPAWDAWFPDGPDTPDLVVLEVRATTGEFWNVSAVDTLRYVFEAGKAIVQGDRVDPSKIGDHQTVDVRPS